MESEGKDEPATTQGYLEQMTLEETDTRELIDSSDSESSESESEGPTTTGPTGVRRRSTKKKRVPPKWWCQHPGVKNNYLVVIGAWFLVCVSIVCFAIGVVLEVLYHAASVDVFRGFILMVIAVVLLIPSGYAVTHIYLAAKGVGRIRMSSVWFFR